MKTSLSKDIVFLGYLLQYDEVLLVLDGLYNYVVSIHTVHGYSKSKLLVKEIVSLKSKIRFGNVCFWSFLFSQFPILINLQPTNLSSVEATEPFVLSSSLSDIFKS